jgi:hypothetical protein
MCKVEFRFIETKDGKKKLRMAKRVQQAEYDDSELDRLNLSDDSASHSADESEYDLDGFVVGDDASVDASDATSSDATSSVDASGSVAPQLSGVRSVVRLLADESEESASESSIQPKRRLRRRLNTDYSE